MPGELASSTDRRIPSKLAIERRALQVAVSLLSLVPVSAGLSGILVGPAFLNVTPPFPADVASHLAYLSGLLLAVGLGFWSCVPSIEARSARFRSLTIMVAIGGLARLLALVTGTTPSGGHLRPCHGARRDARPGRLAGPCRRRGEPLSGR